MPAGYSKRPLAEKLGFKAGMRAIVLDPPPGYGTTLGSLPPGLVLVKTVRAPLDLVQWFTKSRSALERRFPALAKALSPAGALWISWPKKASKVATDLDEGVVREVGLAHGLVDVKVCAVDETWSGLKFVRRLRDR